MQNKIIEKVIEKDKIKEWINELIKNYEIIAPVKVDKDTFFRIINSADEIDFDFIDESLNTKLSPKEFFLSQSEIIFKFNRENIENNNVEDNNIKKRIIFGIRPCDVHSLTILDNVYKENFEDLNYREKRENTHLISLACNKPKENCFCESINLSNLEAGIGADIILTDIGDRFYVEFENKENKNLNKNLNLNSGLFKDCTEEDKKIKEKNRAEFKNKFYTSMNLKNIEKLENIFNDKYWERAAKKCISCGVCTFLCPTCYCFDVFDESMITEHKGKRMKCWDSCMFPDFTLLAGGENPRKTKTDRFKQRIYHKFKYFPEKYGKIQCTGCGRCISACPVNLNIIHIIKDLKKI